MSLFFAVLLFVALFLVFSFIPKTWLEKQKLPFLRGKSLRIIGYICILFVALAVPGMFIWNMSLTPTPASETAEQMSALSPVLWVLGGIVAGIANAVYRYSNRRK